MGYTRNYVGKSREELDEDAINDIRAYLNEEQWDIMQQGVGQVLSGEMSVMDLNRMLGFAGISGRPFHAFCRRYCLEQYRAWMAEGERGVKTDEKGFRIEEVAT